VPLTVTVVLSGRVIDQFSFGMIEKVVVGREKGSEIHLDNLGVSRRHCEIARVVGGAYVVRDLTQAQQTLLNGAPVTGVGDLVDGDCVRAGKFILCVGIDGVAGALPVPRATEGTGEGVFGNMTLDNVEAVKRGQARSLELALGFLVVPGQQPARAIRLEACHVLLGAVADPPFKLEGWRAPRVAAVLSRGADGFRVIDASPDGGAVQINGKPRAVAALGDGDLIEVGGLAFRFQAGHPGPEHE
jgi:FHA domain